MATKTAAKKTTEKKGDGQAKIATYNDLYMFQRGLMRAERVGNRFSYIVSKNLRMVNIEIEDLEKVIEQNEKMKEYHKKVEVLNKEYALKDEEGEFILRDTVIQGEKAKIYRIPGKGDPISKYGKALQKLKDEYKEEIDAQEKKVEEYNTFLKESFTWEPAMIDLNDVPDAAGPVMDAIIFMIKDKEL